MTHKSRLCHIVIDVDDLERGLAFWSAALDAEEESVNPESTEVYRLLRLPDSQIRLLLQCTHDAKQSKERVHVDLETDDVEAEVRRLEELGATRLGSSTRARIRFLGHVRSMGKRILHTTDDISRLARTATTVELTTAGDLGLSRVSHLSLCHSVSQMFEIIIRWLAKELVN